MLDRTNQTEDEQVRIRGLNFTSNLFYKTTNRGENNRFFFASQYLELWINKSD